MSSSINNFQTLLDQQVGRLPQRSWPASSGMQISPSNNPSTVTLCSSAKWKNGKVHQRSGEIYRSTPCASRELPGLLRVVVCMRHCTEPTRSFGISVDSNISDSIAFLTTHDRNMLHLNQPSSKLYNPIHN